MANLRTQGSRFQDPGKWRRQQSEPGVADNLHWVPATVRPKQRDVIDGVELL